LLLDVDLPVAPSAPSDARRAVEDCALPTPGRVDDLRLLVSELVTNAVRHGQMAGLVTLRLLRADQALRVEVTESEPTGWRGPETDPRNGPDHGGWGLHLVGELADRWGVDLEPATTVWFEFDLAQSGHGAG
jgi:anti-sigma regulatory factor (Ser/Thr protein kinase)